MKCKNTTTLYERFNGERIYKPKPIKREENYVLTQVDKLEETTGTIITESTYVKQDNVTALNKYKVADFSLNNLIAVGASLNPVTMSKSTVETIDNLTHQCANINESLTKYN